MRILRAIVAVILVSILLVVAVSLWLATYNIAATQPHFPGVSWFLTAVRNRSIKTQSAAIIPPALTDPSLIQMGVQEYHAMCETCHGSPGRAFSEIGQGLNPKPPKLDTAEVQTYRDSELYWIIAHGIRMTGMPAFGPTHEERALWSLVAFLRKLPGMNAQQYAAMVEATNDYHHTETDTHTHSHTPNG